ncbi:SDR family NAD(P)-dependent oxidoreductase [Sphingomonas sp. BIUV-7]|uniref:SDR family NAD(P)-dependent oxidoreductase n=1 Tax=Sphingomonas natans TaxID=3063330 RepID=A0ABT8YAA6_9SPHN|nr:SDR family NAD(P)-dependent oxidoreductase [Sphingomonas sp. BIUV-7]MDO6415268.1 SDR family NAD(P)-dependent oxidoreductase [Sphingomonas sp. BIUV-7]
MRLDGKVCVIAGAGSPRGIGYATAKLFSQHGAIVVLTDIVMTDGLVDGLREEIGDPAAPAPVGIRCDITDYVQCEAMMDDVVARFGRFDCLINSAGIVDGRPFLEIDDAMFDRMSTVNLKGSFNLCKAALRVFNANRSGVIVNISSAAAQRGGGLVGAAHYAASKGGVISLTRAIAREFGPRGIRANVICPAMIETDMLNGVNEEQQKSIVEAIPLRRLGTPEELAGTCLFLASDFSGFITGATIDVNGGTHIH